MSKAHKIIFGIHLIIGFCLLALLFMIRHQSNWIAEGLRELLKITLISITITFVIIEIGAYLKSKSKKSILFGFFGVLPCLLAIPFYSPNFLQFNRLTGKEESIQMTHIAWACDCANWATDDDMLKYSGNDDDSLAYYCIFIEPAENSLELPDSLNASRSVIKFTGQFYEKRGFPKNYRSDQNPDMARIFRYTKYEVVYVPTYLD